MLLPHELMVVDLQAHNGLRGVAALWVMLFHCFLYSEVHIDFQGSSIMPLFFMLSGYSLAITYARKQLIVHPEGVSLVEESGHGMHLELTSPNKSFSWFQFYRNRFARVFPLYYLCSFVAIPYWVAGYGGAPGGFSAFFLISVFTSLVPVCTFFIFLFGSSLDGPGWTVCTLAIIWLFFPYLNSRARSLSDTHLLDEIGHCFRLQLVLVLVLFFVLIGVLGFWPAFAAATMHPFSRMPLFCMGLYAGELSVRRHDSLWPWRSGTFGCYAPLYCCTVADVDATPLTTDQKVADELMWSGRLDSTSLGLLVVSLSFTALDTINRYALGGQSILGAVYLQAIVPYAQLLVIVACTRDGGRSMASRLCLRTPLAQWLGKVSMAIYLIHFLVIYYLLWIKNGPAHYPEHMDCTSYIEGSAQYKQCTNEVDQYRNATTLPLWAIPIVVVITLILSELVVIGFEEPCRKALRS